MLLACIRKELLANILSLRYGLVFALFLLLSLAATVVRTGMYNTQLTHYRDGNTERYRTLQMPERFNESRGLGITVANKPNPLAIFAAGLEDEMTRSYRISSWSDPRTGGRTFCAPSMRYFARLDMVLIVGIVCSLLAMLLVFDAISGERENGTLKVLLSGPVPRDTVILGKFIAGLVTLLAPLLLAWALSLFYTLSVAHVSFTPEQYLRLWCVIAASVLYICFFFSLGIAVSSWANRSATVLAVCLFCWVVFTLAVPNLVPMVVRNVSPIPARSKIAVERDAIYRTVEDELMPKWQKELMATGTYKDEEELWDAMRPLYLEETEKRLAKIDRFYNAQIGNQLTLNLIISRISPAASFVFVSTHCAGSGIQDFLRLLNEVDQYQRSFLDAQAEAESKRDRDAVGMAKRTGRVVDAYDGTKWPAFTPRTIALPDVLKECWVDIGLLFGGTVILFLVAFVGFVRKEV